MVRTEEDVALKGTGPHDGRCKLNVSQGLPPWYCKSFRSILHVCEADMGEALCERPNVPGHGGRLDVLTEHPAAQGCLDCLDCLRHVSSRELVLCRESDQEIDSDVAVEIQCHFGRSGNRGFATELIVDSICVEDRFSELNSYNMIRQKRMKARERSGRDRKRPTC
jgi:hypothetical protein